VAFTGTGTIYSGTSFYNLSKSTGGTTSYNAGLGLSVAHDLAVSAGDAAVGKRERERDRQRERGGGR